MLVCACLTGHLYAQTSSLVGAGGNRSREPYKAEFKRSSVQTLADGTTIARETIEITAHDAQGRVMMSTTVRLDGGDKPEKTSVSVSDPVSGTHTNWNSEDEKAVVWKMVGPDPAGGCTASIPPHLSAAVDEENWIDNRAVSNWVLSTSQYGNGGVRDVRSRTKQDLGTETIQGVQAQGYRTIVTTPAGTVGNDRPLVTTFEIWKATDSALKGMVVREVFESLQRGHFTKELVSLTPGEPDESLFLPPEGYQVKELPRHPVPCRVTRSETTN